MLDATNTEYIDLRFSDPLIGEIRETWLQRQRLVEAQRKLTLQIKASIRSLCYGDKKEAAIVYDRMMKAGPEAAVEPAYLATSVMLQSRELIEQHRDQFEKKLKNYGKQLPIAHLADQIKGVNYNTLAAIVGECGDLSKYPSIQGVWKRCGVGVVNGQRQRMVSQKECKEVGIKPVDMFHLQGYSPSRRAVMWNIGEALFKSQGKDENAGPYRRIYDERKAYERLRVETDGHAHKRAQRYMLKELLKDITLEWRRVAGESDLLS